MWYPKIILKKQGTTGDPCTHEFPDSIKPQKKFRVIDNVPNVRRQFSPYTFQHFKATSTLEVLQNKDLAHHQDVKKFHANKSPMFKKKKKIPWPITTCPTKNPMLTKNSLANKNPITKNTCSKNFHDQNYMPNKNFMSNTKIQTHIWKTFHYHWTRLTHSNKNFAFNKNEFLQPSLLNKIFHNFW